MSMGGSEQYDLLDQLAEEFAARFRRGERPSLTEYTDRFPELAEEIRELFPALVKVEQVEGARQVEDGSEATGDSRTASPPMRQIGDYRILREVGRGGMGVVYEAEQVSLGRRVALKVLPGHSSRDRIVQERFRREARAAARLHHTNIVPVYEVGQDGDVRFYAMQFIQGLGLDSVVNELRRLLDRAVSQPNIKAALDRIAFQPTAERRGRDIEAPTLAEGIELSAVLQNILTGRLDSAQQPAGNLEATLAGARAGGHATPSEIGKERRAAGVDPALTRTDAGVPFAADGTDAPWDHSPAPALSPSGSQSTSSAILPGGAQLSSVESGRRGYFRSLAQIGRQVAGGLAYAHARGIVHRDIKPSNLLLDTDGVVWITDFGLAKAEDDGLTATGDLLGTLRYMAPERFRGQGDARADVYALGLTLYELLALRPAYDSSDRLKLIEKVKAEEPARPRSIDRRIPRDLETIVLKAIEKEPRSRYQTADAMAEDLRRYLADEPIKARQVSTSERYWRWARRNPVIATLGGVLTAVLIAVTVGSLVAASQYETIARSEKLANAQSQLDRKDAIEARRQAIKERDNSRRLSSSLTLEKGIALAQEGHADRGLLWMLEALKAAPEDAVDFQRAVRWNLGAWLGQVHKPLRIIDTAGPSDNLAFSPDGRSFATGFNPPDRAIARTIDFWDAASGRKLSSLPGTFAPFAFRPDGQVFVAHADAWRMVALDVATGQVLWTTGHLLGDWGESIDFSRDGSTVLALRRDKPGKGNAWLLQIDVATGRQHGEPIRGGWPMAVAPDGKAFATFHIENSEAYIDVHDLPSGRRKSSWPAGKWDVYRLLFGPDGKSLCGVVVEGDAFNNHSFFVQAWDAVTGRPNTPLMARTDGVVYTPSADRILTQVDNVMLLRDAATGRVRGSGFHLDDVSVSVYRLSFHPDGRNLITLGRDNTVRSWQIAADTEPVSAVATDKPTPTKGMASNRQARGMYAISSSLRSDGQIAVSPATGAAARELLQITDPAAGRPLGRPAAHLTGWVIGSVAFSPDGNSIATGSLPDGRVAGEVRLWNTITGRLRLPPMPHTNYVRALAFQPDGKVLAAGDYNGLVRFWDTSTGREIGRPLSQGEIVLSLAYSPDCKLLAVGLAKDHTGRPGTRLWDTTTGRPIGELLPSTDNVNRIDFRPDGRALVAGTNALLGTNRATGLWDTIRAEAIGEPINGEISGGFRPDGRAFLTLGSDGTIKLREATTGKGIATLLIASSAATCATFRGDGGLIAAGFEDGTVRLCDPATNQPVGPPRSMSHAVRHVAFLPDGRSVAALDEFGGSRTWPVPEPLENTSLDDLALRIEARTGLRMEAGLFISRLGAAAWSERLEQLGQLDPAAVRPDTDPAWHEPMVLEAEQTGNSFAAKWHLDRLIAARPDDWSLYARRGRAWSWSDKFDEASRDYQQAERLGNRDDVLDFQAHCVLDCTKAERWAAALWYLDRLIAARPDDGRLHEDRAAVYGRLGREADRRAELARVFELGADEGLVIPRAEELGRAGRWAEAECLLARCGRTGPLSRELAQAWVIACLKAGDRAGYREATTAFLACQGPDPTVVWNALAGAGCFALGTEGLDSYQLPMGWCEKRLSAVPAPGPLYRHLLSSALGGLLLRAGRLDEAIARVSEGIAAKEIELPTDWAYLAVAHARKGDFAEARRSLQRLRAAGPDSSASFWDIQELALLRSEAQSLLFDAEFPSDPFQSRRPK
jgi:serine/threonine protein kinase/WD40 repeat protein/Flp pilus assembly protein TadD